MNAAPSAKWERASKGRPCPICGKPDWCLIAAGGSAAICARIKSGWPVGSKGAGWLHKLDGPAPLPSPRHRAGFTQTPKAPPDVLNATYSALLAALELSAAHRDNLRRRGLSDAEIDGLGYRSLPPDGRRDDVAARLRAKGVRLAGVPGFCFRGGLWRLVPGRPGIAIPVRDVGRRIVGLQVRRDAGEDGPRYVWLSSRAFPHGCSPGVPVHVAGPRSTVGDIWISEGPLKADIASLRLCRPVLAVAGVGNWHGALAIVQALRPERVIVAFDQDKTTNPAVRLHLEALEMALLKAGLRTFEADWEPARKGLDDLVTMER